jgi:aminoglycoside phosphotransferase (APT) family kinase protein
MHAALAAALTLENSSPAATVENLQRLTGGANMETWSFDWHEGQSCTPAILRRLPGSDQANPAGVTTINLATEAQLLSIAAANNIAVPKVLLLLQPRHGLGAGYVMSREPGEALPSRILKDDRYTEARNKLAWQCGQTLAKIHGIARTELPAGLRDLDMAEDLDRIQLLLDQHGNSSPVHQLALNWLRDNRPQDTRRCLVHGDFRNGNLLVTAEGLSSVLDWELAHIGYPGEDLGYLCANVWRFGRDNKSVGGFGDYQDLLAGYGSIAGSAAITLEDIHYWEVYAALSWGLVCLTMIDMYRSGHDRSLERVAVGRRLSESEIDLLLLLDGKLLP